MLRNNALPLYYQIETILRRKILSGEFEPGSNIPSESKLIDEFQVSRITIRQALALLEQDGLIVRRRGKGTFVPDSIRSMKAPRLNGTMEDLINMSKQTDANVLEVTMTEAPEHVKKHLKLEGNSQVLRIKKIRSVDGEPISYVQNYLPFDIGSQINQDDLKSKPLLVILEEDLGISLVESLQTLEASIADAEVTSLLQIRVGDPLLKVERTVYSTNRRPIEHVSVLYRSDKYFFSIKLKRKRSKTSTSSKTSWKAM